MTSIKQIEANRRNARLSTGPRTIEGRARSSQNAVRHGLTAETVIEPLEDLEEYKLFELAITADFEARTAVERELVLRLSSLLWRLRRATAIETGLLQIQALAPERQQIDRPKASHQIIHQVGADVADDAASERLAAFDAPGSASRSPSHVLNLARSFLRLSELDSQILDRVGRYEAALWRQVGQVLFTLERLRSTSFRNCY